jgi:hypothetical protein
MYCDWDGKDHDASCSTQVCDRVITQEQWPQAMLFGSTIGCFEWTQDCCPTRSTAIDTAEVLANCNDWDCPVFVLEPKLHKSGVQIPKSQQGINVGFSRLHSSLIALVLNTTTKTITTQFHVVLMPSPLSL